MAECAAGSDPAEAGSGNALPTTGETPVAETCDAAAPELAGTASGSMAVAGTFPAPEIGGDAIAIVVAAP